MTWKTTGAWKNPITKPNNDDSSFPGLKPTTPDTNNIKIENEELQQNELLALEAIYGEDFVKHSGTNSAWQVGLVSRQSAHVQRQLTGNRKQNLASTSILKRPPTKTFTSFCDLF